MRSKSVFLVLGLLFIVLLFPTISSLPNIKTNWVQYNSTAQRIVAEIVNDSSEDANGFIVEFFVDGKSIGFEGGENNFILERNSIMHVFKYFPNDEKNHLFEVIVDPNNLVEELDETDNSQNEVIKVMQEEVGVDNNSLPEKENVSAEFNYDYLFLIIIILLVIFIGLIIFFRKRILMLLSVK